MADLNKKGGSRRRSRKRRRPPKKVQPQYESVVHVPKRYSVVFYDTLEMAKNSCAELLEKAKDCDQLNIVIRCDADMDDPELLQYGKVFAGEAWTLVHERRVEDGWYDEPR